MTEAALSKKLVGTWKLVEVRGDITETFGKTPQGFFSFSEDGRTLVLITAEKRPKIEGSGENDGPGTG